LPTGSRRRSDPLASTSIAAASIARARAVAGVLGSATSFRYSRSSAISSMATPRRLLIQDLPARREVFSELRPRARDPRFHGPDRDLHGLRDLGVGEVLPRGKEKGLPIAFG